LAEGWFRLFHIVGGDRFEQDRDRSAQAGSEAET
jgi:hypothetical protein